MCELDNIASLDSCPQQNSDNLGVGERVGTAAKQFFPWFFLFG
jgi:hypothetical protein